MLQEFLMVLSRYLFQGWTLPIINLISPAHTLLPVALDRLKNREREREKGFSSGALPSPSCSERSPTVWWKWTASTKNLPQLPLSSCLLAPAWQVQGWLEWLLECEFDSWIFYWCLHVSPVSITFQKWSHGEGLEICAVSKSTQSLCCWSIYF